MPPAPPVSVVIPAYNRAGTIRTAIESVLRQSWTDFELIVVDDGSRDGTLAAAAEVADPRLRLVESPRNQGAAGARNTGAAEARGDWLAFQDSDDEWLPLKLEKQMARLAADPGHVGAYCGLLSLGRWEDGPGSRLGMRYVPDRSVTPAEGDIVAPLLEANMVSTQTLVVRRAHFLELGGFDQATSPIEDWDFVIRLARRGRLAFVDEPLVLQYWSPDSITRDRSRALAAQARLVEKHADLFAAHPRALARQYFSMAGGHRNTGDLAAARRCLAAARRIEPANPRHWAMSLYVAALGLRPSGARARA